MKRRIKTGIVSLLSLGLLASIGFAHSDMLPMPNKQVVKNAEFRKLSHHQIAIRADGKSYVVDLYDNPTANDLLTKLPLSLNVTNYPGYDEKVIRLAQPLSMEGAPKGDEPLIPEVGYYSPGQWIAVYYGYIGYWDGKVPLGQIRATNSEISSIQENGTITIEKIK